MKLSWNYRYAALAIIALAATYWFVSVDFAGRLEFRQRTFPPGTRDLVFQQGVSPFDAALAPIPDERPGAQASPNAAEVCRALFRDERSPSSGASGNPVQIVTFLDFRCPYCKVLSNMIADMHVDSGRFIFRDWPILGDASTLAARAALAADRQGKYLAFHNRLMNTRLIPTPALIDSIAGELGLDIGRLHADMNADATSQSLRQTAALAAALGLTGTPTLVVGRTVVQGNITRRQLEKLIDDERRLPPVKDC